MGTELSKKYYKIKEVAELIGVPEATSRFWETQFHEISPRRTGTNLRQYSQKDIETIRIVHYLLKVKGLKIEAAANELRHNRKNVSKKLIVIEKLEAVKSQLQVLYDSLKVRGDKLSVEDTEENL